MLFGIGFILFFLFLTISGATKISGRVLMLIDPSQHKSSSALVESVAEHAPSVWMNYYEGFGALILYVPIGFYFTLVHKLTHGKLFLGMYGVFIVYFSCVMKRLVIVLAPAVCAIAAIAIAQILRKATKSIRLAMLGRYAPQP